MILSVCCINSKKPTKPNPKTIQLTLKYQLPQQSKKKREMGKYHGQLTEVSPMVQLGSWVFKIKLKQISLAKRCLASLPLIFHPFSRKPFHSKLFNNSAITFKLAQMIPNYFILPANPAPDKFQPSYLGPFGNSHTKLCLHVDTALKYCFIIEHFYFTWTLKNFCD